MTKFISVVSGKGGTGKTIVAINLALALNEFGHNVILMDTDLRSADIGLMLGMSPQYETIHDALAGKRDITEVVYHHPSGLHFIPASITSTSAKHTFDASDALHKLRGTTEMVIMDLPAGFHQEVFSLLKLSDETIIVTNPELPAVADAIRTIELVREAQGIVRGVVVNRYSDDETSMPLATIQEMLEMPILGVIPEDMNIKRSVKLKFPVTYAFPTSPASASFKQLAAELLGRKKKILH